MITIKFDLETTANGGPKGDDPGAEWPNNRVLCCCYVEYGVDDEPQHKTIREFVKWINELLHAGRDIELIAHNLMFDLKWLIREGLDTSRVDQISPRCTMVNHYIYTGYQEKFIGLEDLCDYWKVSYSKGLDLGAMLNAGLKMEDISLPDLIQYCKEDVLALSKLPVFEYDTDYLLPLAEMELQGLPIDVEKCEGKLLENQQIMDSVWLDFKDFIQNRMEWSDGKPVEDKDFQKKIKPLANRTVSYILTGEPKTGIKVGTKSVKFCQNSAGYLLTPGEIARVWGNKTPTNLGYPVGTEYLEQLLNTHYMVNEVLKYRKAAKLADTYFGPWLETAKHSNSGCTIHPSYNPCATNTGRLSSSNPNGQNIPPEAKTVIKPWDHDYIMELDFKQLEMHAVAALSKSSQLIADLNNGVDIHFETGKTVFDWRFPSDMNEQDRRTVKGVNFGLLYGGGPATISAQTGCDKKTVKELIDAFYYRYPSVAEWHESYYRQVIDHMSAYDVKDGEQRYYSMVPCELSGRSYTYIEKPSPDWLKRKTGRSFSFKPTETKNYPVQGFAGACIVMRALEEMYKQVKIQARDVSFYATVHDSIVIGTCEEPSELSNLIETIQDYVTDFYNLPTKVTLDTKHGEYWQEEK